LHFAEMRKVRSDVIDVRLEHHSGYRAGAECPHDIFSLARLIDRPFLRALQDIMFLFVTGGDIEFLGEVFSVLTQIHAITTRGVRTEVAIIDQVMKEGVDDGEAFVLFVIHGE